MFRHRSATTAVALAAAAALIPGTAFAAGSTPATSKAVRVVTDTPAENEPAALKTFSSPASKSLRLQQAAIAGTAHGAAAAKATASAATTIYVAAYSYATCTDGTGAGSQADPYCSIQDAVNAAVSGDTVDILGYQGYDSTEAVTVSTSGISIVGVGNQAWDVAPSGSPAFILNGVSDVTLSNLMLTGSGGADSSPALEVLGSSDITLDSDYIQGGYLGVADPTGPGIEIDGASNNVTVSRTYVNTGLSAPSYSGIAVESGARDVTLTGDILASSGISATGVTGLYVTGDTIQRGCDAAIDVEGSSSAVYLEDNLIEDANSSTDALLGGYQSDCQNQSTAWAPDVTIAADATAGTVTDYNDFYVFTADGTDEYDWAGTAYASLSAFQTAAGQGSHDTLDPVQARPAGFRPNATSDVDAYPAAGSSAIGSANVNAPGRLPSDYFGDTPYTSRGAVQFNTHNQSLAVSLDVVDVSARGIDLTATVTSASGYTLEPEVYWGDGNSTDVGVLTGSSFVEDFTYAKLGTYTVSVTVNDEAGDVVTNSVAVTLAGTTYTKFGPTRLLDTRKGTGTGGVVAPIPANGKIKLKIDGAAGIAASASALAANITVTDAKAEGYITAYPDGISPAALSSVNFTAGRNVANTAVVSVGADGYIVLANRSPGTVDVILDASGYFTPSSSGDGYTSITPQRFLDTRSGTGGYAYKTVSQGRPVTLKVEGKNSIPASGVAAVAVNITEANATGNGLITAWPGGSAEPGTSNLNFATGDVRAASAIVPVGANGTIDLAYSGSGAARLIVDVEGYFSSTGSQYVPVFPYRALDTRQHKNGVLQGGWYYEIEVASYDGLGPDTITGMVSNTTVTAVTAKNGDLVIFPNVNISSDSPVTVPSTSALNFVKGQTVANLSFVTPGYGGDEDYYNQSAGNLQLIIDIMGYFMAN